MGFNNFPYQFPTASSQFVNPQSGQPTLNFWQFVQALFNRTGASNGTTYQAAVGLTATGTTQATALPLGADWNQVTTVASGSGVLLPSMQPGSDISVWNAGANPLLIYPFSGAAINTMSVNAPYSLAAGHLAYFQTWTPTQILLPYDVAV